MRTVHDEVLDDLEALVAGDAEAIARHADHLASCDACRDARHDASQLAKLVANAGSDHVPDAGLADRLLAQLDAGAPAPAATTPTENEPPTATATAATTARAVTATAAATTATPTAADATSASTPVPAEPAKAEKRATEPKIAAATSASTPVPAEPAKAAKRATEPKVADATSENTPAEPAKAAKRSTAPRSIAFAPARRPKLVIAAGALAALAAGAIGVVAVTRGGDDPAASSTLVPGGPIGKVATISRAAADDGDGIALHTATGWRALRSGELVPAGAELRTDERTRTSLEMSDGTRIVLDHRTHIAFDASEPRRFALHGGRIATDVAHIAERPAAITTPSGRIDVLGTRFMVSATDSVTAVQVVRGTVALDDGKGTREEIRAGEEGIIENGSLSVSAAPSLAKETAWSELAPPPANAADDQATAGLGALRAYKPGEKRDRDWKLALANHEVKVRIVGPIARTEITETFRNDSDTTLEGVYQFPLPPDAQIDSLALDMKDAPGGFIQGAFVDKERAAKIWRGVIEKATPRKIARDPLIQHEIVWVPGPWRDPALLDWKRGGRFELRIFPIPAKGERTIKLAYTQVVTPRGPNRQYVYPLPHSTDGSTVADRMKVDIEVRGARPGTVRTTGYQLVADPSRADVGALTLEQSGFVPRGDLVLDYRVDSDAELRAWTFTGGAAVGPDEKLAGKKRVGIDPKVVEAQRLVAADARPTAVLALSPKLPRWQESKPRDYVIVIDGSQSMVGERFARASGLAVAMIDAMDRRDRFGMLVCDSECTKLGDLRAPTRAAAGNAKAWLAAHQPAGASDVVAALRAGTDELSNSGAQRERWVLYIGDGFASTGFRRVADVEKAIAATTRGSGVNISTIGVGTDADSALLAAAARAGGGSYLAWVPGQSVGMAALAALESSYGTTLRDATVELPAGLAEVAAAGGAPGTTTTTTLPTLRAGGEVLIAARMAGDVDGEVVLRGKVAGQTFEQRYPLKLAVSSAAGNGFVPRLWASLAIDQLERQGNGEDRARIVALSQGYGVMSRQTSLLVLESQAMFDAFGVDRGQPTATWSGEDELDEVATSGVLEVAAGTKPAKAKRASGPGMGGGAPATAALDDGDFTASRSTVDTDARRERVRDKADEVKVPAAEPRRRPVGRRISIAMKRVWTRHAALAAYTGVDPAITKAIAKADDDLALNPDSREKHRALVQALSYAGELDRARDIATRWLERDKLDPQALGYIADLMGRDGQRDLALRTLAGLVDLDADRAPLHERMINAYERTGRLAQACSHRIALVTLSAKEMVKRAAAAARCLRTLGRAADADLVIESLPDDKAKSEAEKAATVAPITPRIAGDLVIAGSWTSSADLDISLVAPDGTRVSWMGGRKDVIVADSTSHSGEQLAIKRLRKGNYLVEISRGEPSTDIVRGTLEVTVLGQKRAFPFELTGSRVTAGKISVRMQSRLEPVNPADARWLRPGWQQRVR